MAAEPAPAGGARLPSVERGLGLASLGAVLAYVALRAASIRFYDSLGVTPEELGLGQVDLLARSVGLLVILFVIAAAVAAVIAALAVVSTVDRIWSSVFMPLVSELYRAPAWYQGIVVTIGIVAFGVGLLRQNLLEFGPLVIYPAGGWVGYMIWRRKVQPLDIKLRDRTHEQWRLLRSLFGRVWRFTVAVVALLSLVTVSIVVTNSASLAGNAVRKGEAYRDWAVPWRADPATVRWLRTPPGDDALTGRCLMYLGQGSAALVFYDVDSHRIVRVPSAEVILLVATEAPTCSRG